MTWILALGICLFRTSVSHADQYADLATYAKQVPHSEIDREVLQYIANETNESIEGIRSHYALALFENLKSGRSWYVLDGYYVLKSGKILFLDFQYNPKNKTWWAIENYRPFLPGLSERFMLEADEVCNPYKRHFIGIVSLRMEVGGAVNAVGIDRLQTFFAENYGRQPIFLLNDGDLLVIDPTKAARMSRDVLFTLNERDLIASLGKATAFNAKVIPSGREGSTVEIKKTYVGSTSTCDK